MNDIAIFNFLKLDVGLEWYFEYNGPKDYYSEDNTVEPLEKYINNFPIKDKNGDIAAYNRLNSRLPFVLFGSKDNKSMLVKGFTSKYVTLFIIDNIGKPSSTAIFMNPKGEDPTTNIIKVERIHRTFNGCCRMNHHDHYHHSDILIYHCEDKNIQLQNFIELLKFLTYFMEGVEGLKVSQFLLENVKDIKLWIEDPNDYKTWKFVKKGIKIDEELPFDIFLNAFSKQADVDRTTNRGIYLDDFFVEFTLKNISHVNTNILKPRDTLWEDKLDLPRF